MPRKKLPPNVINMIPRRNEQLLKEELTKSSSGELVVPDSQAFVTKEELARLEAKVDKLADAISALLEKYPLKD